MVGNIDKVVDAFLQSPLLSLYLISGERPIASSFGVNSIFGDDVLSDEDIKKVLERFLSASGLSSLYSCGKYECIVNAGCYLHISAFYNNSAIGIILNCSGCSLKAFVSPSVVKKISKIASFGQGIVTFLAPDDGSKDFIAKSVINCAFEADRGNIVIIGSPNKIQRPQVMNSTSSLFSLDVRSVLSKSDISIYKPDIVIFNDMDNVKMIDIALEIALTNCLVLIFSDICFIDSLLLMFSSISSYGLNGLKILSACIRSIVFHIFVKKHKSDQAVLLYDEIICSDKIKDSISASDFSGLTSKLREMVNRFVFEEVLDFESAEKALLKLDRYHTYDKGVSSIGDF